MYKKLAKLLSNFSTKTFNISETQPLNKLSLVFLICVDIFVLFNVFIGLGYAANIIPTSAEIYPCQSIFSRINQNSNNSKISFFKDTKIYYSSSTSNKLPYSINPVCNEFKDKFNTVYDNLYDKYFNTISKIEKDIYTRENQISNYTRQYDSALLERIADQKQQNSINSKSATEIKSEIDKLTKSNAEDNARIDTLKTNFLKELEVKNTLQFIADNSSEINQKYQDYEFWYGLKVLIAQLLFLAPLIVTALWRYRIAINKTLAFQALIFWHLFLVFLIPAILQLLIFIQLGYIFSLFFQLIESIFSGFLVFGVYASIIIIPFVGFYLLKSFQKFVFNDKILAISRVQRQECVHCAKKLRIDDIFCPYCGTGQFENCKNCNTKTYKHLKYCKNCGAEKFDIQLNL